MENNTRTETKAASADGGVRIRSRNEEDYRVAADLTGFDNLKEFLELETFFNRSRKRRKTNKKSSAGAADDESRVLHLRLPGGGSGAPAADGSVQIERAEGDMQEGLLCFESRRNNWDTCFCWNREGHIKGLCKSCKVEEQRRIVGNLVTKEEQQCIALSDLSGFEDLEACLEAEALMRRKKKSRNKKKKKNNRYFGVEFQGDVADTRTKDGGLGTDEMFKIEPIQTAEADRPQNLVVDEAREHQEPHTTGETAQALGAVDCINSFTGSNPCFSSSREDRMITNMSFDRDDLEMMPTENYIEKEMDNKQKKDKNVEVNAMGEAAQALVAIDRIDSFSGSNPCLSSSQDDGMITNISFDRVDLETLPTKSYIEKEMDNKWKKDKNVEANATGETAQALGAVNGIDSFTGSNPCLPSSQDDGMITNMSFDRVDFEMVPTESYIEKEMDNKRKEDKNVEVNATGETAQALGAVDRIDSFTQSNPCLSSSQDDGMITNISFDRVNLETLPTESYMEKEMDNKQKKDKNVEANATGETAQALGAVNGIDSFTRGNPCLSSSQDDGMITNVSFDRVDLEMVPTDSYIEKEMDNKWKKDNNVEANATGETAQALGPVDRIDSLTGGNTCLSSSQDDGMITNMSFDRVDLEMVPTESYIEKEMDNKRKKDKNEEANATGETAQALGAIDGIHSFTGSNPCLSSSQDDGVITNVSFDGVDLEMVPTESYIEKEMDNKQKKDENVCNTDENYQASKSKDMATEAVMREEPVSHQLLRLPRYFNPPSNGWNTWTRSSQDSLKARKHMMEMQRKPCFVCGSFDHKWKKCKQNHYCTVCKGRGHLANNCPEKYQENNLKPDICLRCGDAGHHLFSCMNDYPPDDLKQIQCYVCKNFGHLCCVEVAPADREGLTCYRCGESGHVGSGCTRSTARKSTAIAWNKWRAKR